MSTDPRTERMHRMLHGCLRSQAKCPQCDYVAPMDGPDRIAAALDRVTAALIATASRSSSPVDVPSRPTGTPGPTGPCCQAASDSEGNAHSPGCLYLLGLAAGRTAAAADVWKTLLGVRTADGLVYHPRDVTLIYPKATP